MSVTLRFFFWDTSNFHVSKEEILVPIIEVCRQLLDRGLKGTSISALSTFAARLQNRHVFGEAFDAAITGPQHRCEKLNHIIQLTHLVSSRRHVLPEKTTL